MDAPSNIDSAAHSSSAVADWLMNETRDERFID